MFIHLKNYIICHQIYKSQFLEFQHSYLGTEVDVGYELQDSFEKRKNKEENCEGLFYFFWAHTLSQEVC